MKKWQRNFAISGVLMSLAASNGCALGVAAYGIHKTNETAVTNTDTMNRAMTTQAYATYKSEAEKNNTEREKSGLKPQPVMSMQEWTVANNPLQHHVR
jgi:hypothetical protein